MLTLQMIRIMNKIWIQEGLDMRVVIFKCFSTGRGRGATDCSPAGQVFTRWAGVIFMRYLSSGMVEMIPHADTLRKIQVEHGVTGSFKDRTLADWLQKYNPTDEQYDKVTPRGYIRLV